MTTINKLARADTISAGDLLPAFVTDEGDARAVAVSVLAAYIQTLLTAVDDKVTQYAAPSATGFTVTVTNDDQSVWLILTPVAGYANGAIVLPDASHAVDHQEVLVNCTQAVTTLAVSVAAGATVTGAPTTLAANGFFRMRYDAVTHTWYRVG